MKTETEFEPGDIVILKSGGPLMTVRCPAYCNSTKKVQCIWFEASQLRSCELSPECLRKTTAMDHFASQKSR